MTTETLDGPASAPHFAAPPAVWAPPGDVVLDVRAVVRDLGTTVKTRVLHSVDLVIREREFVSLTGASGASNGRRRGAGAQIQGIDAWPRHGP